MDDLSHEFEQESLLGEVKHILALSLPIILTMTSHTVMQTVDALMLGQHSKDELAAIYPAGLMYYVVAALMMGTVTCNNTFVSQSVGRGRPRDGARYTIHAIYIGLGYQLLFLPLYGVSGNIFGLFGHAPAVAELEGTYFSIRTLGLGATGVIMASSTFFQATNRPMIPLITGVIANVINLFGDWLLIFGKWGFPELGIKGAAAMTVAANWFEAILLIVVFLSWRNHRVYRTRRWAPFEWQRLRQLLSVGIGSGIHWVIDIASWSIFISAVVARLGTDIAAGNSAAGNILHLSFMPTIGLNIGISALVGRHIGEKHIRRAKRVAYIGMGLAASYMGAMGTIFVLNRHSLIALFVKGGDGSGVISAGAVILCYGVLYQIVDGIGIIAYGALKGAGDTRFPAWCSAIVAWCFFVPAGLYFGRADVYGLHGAWISAVIYVWILDVVFFSRFVSERWRKINIFR
jgi:MATE family, multidrug efflux pump